MFELDVYFEGEFSTVIMLQCQSCPGACTCWPRYADNAAVSRKRMDKNQKQVQSNEIKIRVPGV